MVEIKTNSGQGAGHDPSLPMPAYTPMDAGLKVQLQYRVIDLLASSHGLLGCVLRWCSEDPVIVNLWLTSL